jgi:hypothetical protein
MRIIVPHRRRLRSSALSMVGTNAQYILQRIDVKEATFRLPEGRAVFEVAPRGRITIS